MTNGIAVLYDFKTPKNIDYSMSIITALASRGVAFDISPNSERRVALIINGSIYSPEDIGKNQKDILKYAEKIDKMNRQRLRRARESELARMS